MGFKHEKHEGKDNVKNTLIVDLINDICFSSLSKFYEEMYNSQIITEPMQITYESGADFAHTILFAVSKKYKECEEKINEYLEKIRKDGVDRELFEIAKNKKIGEMIYDSESVMQIHRTIIDSLIQKTDVFEEANIVEQITKQDVDNFIIEYLKEENKVISRVIEK
jgi:predicted Zn-dependent peptidase